MGTTWVGWGILVVFGLQNDSLAVAAERTTMARMIIVGLSQLPRLC